MEAGADAVYCGLTEFSARAKARNFNLAETEQLAAYAHREGRKLYVAANTLIKEAELPRIVEVLASLAAAHIDGLIIQDLGLWRIARQYFPEIPLHASTQLAIHNTAGVTMLEKMGFCRAVLARELSLPEITAISRQTTIELEHFIHGALCYSISGQCFFSSYLAGKSGNRGRCVQPCRRLYRGENGQDGYYFSTSDLCTIDAMQHLKQAGIMSFKIEGRMKNAEYVYTVVSAYRHILDSTQKNHKDSLGKAEKILAQSYGRESTSGFLNSNVQHIVSAARKGGIGQQLGQIKKFVAGSVFFTSSQTVHVGDRLRIQPQNDMNGVSFTVRELFIGNKKSKRADTGSFIRIPCPFTKGIGPGDQIYKVSSGKPFTMSEQAGLRRLATSRPEPWPVNLSVSCKENHLLLQASSCGQKLSQSYPVDMIPARHSPLSIQTLQRTFEKTGHANLKLQTLTAENLPPVVIQPSRLKQIRRDFYQQLSVLTEQASVKNHAKRVEEVRKTLPGPVSVLPSQKKSLTVRVKDMADQAVLDNPIIDAFLIPLCRENVEAFTGHAQASTCKSRIIWDIPAVIYEANWAPMQNLVTDLQGDGFKSFRLNNLGHFRFFIGQTENLFLQAGPLLYALNSSAVESLENLGARQFSFSLEDDKKNMADMLCRNLHLAAITTVYCPITLMTSRIPLPMQAEKQLINTSKGAPLHLEYANGLTWVSAGQDFSLLGRLQELQAKGCENFVIDLCQPDTGSKTQTILHAFTENLRLPETSTFNFDRGLA